MEHGDHAALGFLYWSKGGSVYRDFGLAFAPQDKEQEIIKQHPCV